MTAVHEYMIEFNRFKEEQVRIEDQRKRKVQAQLMRTSTLVLAKNVGALYIILKPYT